MEDFVVEVVLQVVVVEVFEGVVLVEVKLVFDGWNERVARWGVEVLNLEKISDQVSIDLNFEAFLAEKSEEIPPEE